MVDDSQRTSEIMVFMIMWVERWWSGVDELVVFGLMFACSLLRSEWMRPTSLFIAQRECPSCLSSGVPSRRSLQLFVWGAFVLKEASSIFNYSPLLLPGQLDCVACFNNCPNYSRMTVYSFYVVLCRTRSYRSGYRRIFFGMDMVFHARMLWYGYGLPRPNKDSSV